MKRVFHHPPEPSNGTKYWRSIGELKDTPEFRQWLEREFPEGTAELNGDEWSRRDFVKLMGASMALAGVGLTSCRRPELHLVPFTKNVEWTIPGKFLYYATAMPRRSGGIPLIATTVDGRPIKLEGNPLHPASGGTTDTFVQASILDLYDPTRSKRFVQKGKASTREEFEKFLGEFGKTILNDQGSGLAFLVEETNSPTRERLRTELEKKFPGMRWCVYEPRLGQEANVAMQTGFGPNARVLPKLDRADVILALDSDFLDCGQGEPRNSARFHFAPTRERIEGQHESAVCGRTSFHPDGRDGGSSAALSSQSDSCIRGMRSRRKFTRERMIPVWALYLEISKARQTLSTSNGLMELPLI